MSRLSVRARLTLWNVGVVALLLVTLGAAVRTAVRTSLSAGIDRELTERAKRLQSETSRRIRYENGKFLFRGRERRDGKPRYFRLDGSDRESDGRGGSPPIPPASDTYAPRFLTPTSESPLFFYRAPAWDKAAVLLSAKSHRLVLRTVLVDAEPLRVATVGIRAGGTNAPQTEPIFVQVAFRLTDIERGLNALDNALWTLLPLSLLVAGASGALITGRALRPVRDITLATDAVAAESLAARLPVTGDDEFGELARRFNRMLDRLEGAFDKQRRFVGDASHELRTPLAIITAHTSLALDDEAPATPDAERKALVAIHGAAGRMNRIVGDLLLLAQGDGSNLPREHRKVEIAPLLRAAATDAQTAYRERTGSAGATVGITDTGAVLPDADAHLLRRVFINLLENALRHTLASGKITVATETHGNMATVTVSDTGCGVAPEHLPHLFDRFYRVGEGRDRDRGGTGLGLSLVQMLVAAHGGAVAIESEPGRGTTVRVTLPV